MKNVLRLLVFAALFTVFALPSYAQDAAAAPTPAAGGPCTEAEAKNALYSKFRENFNKTAEQQKIAYDSGREYLSKYGACPDASDVQIAKYIQTWVGKYEKAVVEFNCTKAANDNPAEAFTACAPLLASNPDNLKVRLALVGAGIKSYANKNNSLNARAAAEARTALQMMESGKTIDVWAPFTSQQEAQAGLRYWIAAWSLEANPAESATQLLKVAQSGDPLAKEPATFQLLATSYYNGELKPKVDEYKAKCEGKEATPECDALLNRINVVLDRVIDAYARAVALSNANPTKYGATANALRPILTGLYKQRHEGEEAGLNELIAKVLSTPLPVPGQEPATAPTPSAANGTTGNGMTATPAGAATTTTPAAGTTPAKPAATATPVPAAKPVTPAAKPATPAQKPPRS
ncbi:MAG TPA: hypothetical protein VF570_15165 [Pyrinomonadaceae bacterium]|jgi:hypothetical protein